MARVQLASVTIEHPPAEGVCYGITEHATCPWVKVTARPEPTFGLIWYDLKDLAGYAVTNPVWQRSEPIQRPTHLTVVGEMKAPKRRR